LPGVGRIFGHTSRTAQQTDIVLTLTPHIVRLLDLTESDLRAFRVSRDSTLSGGGDLPVLPAVLPPPPAQAPAPAPTPATPPAGATPLLPPPPPR